VKNLVRKRSNQIIKEALEAADYWDWKQVIFHLRNLTHKDFIGMNFNFDLTKSRHPEKTREVIQNFFKVMTSIPPERISFTERV
jgi:hypothetical protein